MSIKYEIKSSNNDELSNKLKKNQNILYRELFLLKN